MTRFIDLTLNGISTGAVYAAVALAIWIGAQPWRMRDFLQWIFARRARARGLGGLLAAYGILLAVIAFTY